MGVLSDLKRYKQKRSINQKAQKNHLKGRTIFAEIQFGGRTKT